MNRWVLEMREYSYKIEYKSGKRNVVADQLSRPVRVIQGCENGKWLDKSKEEIKGFLNIYQPPTFSLIASMDSVKSVLLGIFLPS